MKGKKSPGSSLYDRLLVPRIEAYGLNNDYTDVEEVCEHLRTSYREYTRQKLGPFRNQVARAIEAVSRKGGVAKPELQLQVRPQGKCCMHGSAAGAAGARGWAGQRLVEPPRGDKACHHAVWIPSTACRL